MAVFELEYGVHCDGGVFVVDRVGAFVLEPLPDGDVGGGGVVEGAEYVGAVLVGGE